jgi:hypothetical protein
MLRGAHHVTYDKALVAQGTNTAKHSISTSASRQSGTKPARVSPNLCSEPNNTQIN